jgi:hypothetical protein
MSDKPNKFNLSVVKVILYDCGPRHFHTGPRSQVSRGSSFRQVWNLLPLWCLGGGQIHDELLGDVRLQIGTLAEVCFFRDQWLWWNMGKIWENSPITWEIMVETMRFWDTLCSDKAVRVTGYIAWSQGTTRIFLLGGYQPPKLGATLGMGMGVSAPAGSQYVCQISRGSRCIIQAGIMTIKQHHKRCGKSWRFRIH